MYEPIIKELADLLREPSEEDMAALGRMYYGLYRTGDPFRVGDMDADTKEWCNLVDADDDTLV